MRPSRLSEVDWPLQSISERALVSAEDGVSRGGHCAGAGCEVGPMPCDGHISGAPSAGRIITRARVIYSAQLRTLEY